MDGNSQTPQKERLEALRLLMPEVFDEGYIDWEKLKVALGENVNFTNERYVLNWAGKSNNHQRPLLCPAVRNLLILIILKISLLRAKTWRC